ncbi:hypothetical protein ElyMa_001422400 [Elysia marginata]|uniref:Uncharacterized protein n=1 Tax=Elysia marginata TaxID=1093978 RepID=A0AAV4IXG3_9GAST|nr:hypothetical protein ElyMa_001422400 [Elysia marginata]
MLMAARPNSRRQTHLNHQDPHPASHGSHLTANKVPNSRERSRFRGIESQTGRQMYDRNMERRQSKKERACLYSLLLCHARQAYGRYNSLLPSK